jgi:hypothetical protein
MAEARAALAMEMSLLVAGFFLGRFPAAPVDAGALRLVERVLILVEAGRMREAVSGGRRARHLGRANRGRRRWRVGDDGRRRCLGQAC